MSIGYLLCVCAFSGYLLSLCHVCITILKQLRINKYLFLFALFGGGWFLCILPFWETMPYIFRTSCSHVLFLVLLLIGFQDEPAKKLLTAAILMITKTLVWHFGGSFLSLVVLIILYVVTGGQTTGIAPEADYVISSIAYGIVVAAVFKWKKLLDAIYENKVKSWYYMLAIPLMLLVVIVDVVNWGASNGIMVVSNNNGEKYWNIFYNQIFSHIAICLLTLLVMCIAGGLVFGMNRIYMEQREKERYHAQIAFYHMMQEQYTQMERLRHDMKNHLTGMYGMWKSGAYENIGHYLEKMLAGGNLSSYEEATGNHAIDALLYNKKKQVKQCGADWQCDVQIPKTCVLETYDLCILFGNLLDNAIHANEKITNTSERFVHVRAGNVRKCFLIVVQNRTDMKDAKEFKPGIGLWNVQETVQQYQGVLDIKIENHVFEISILIPEADNGCDVKLTV